MDSDVEKTVNGLIDSFQALRVLLTELRQKFPWKVIASVENETGRPYVEFRVRVPSKVSIKVVEAHLEETFPWMYDRWTFVPAETASLCSQSENVWYRRISL